MLVDSLPDSGSLAPIAVPTGSRASADYANVGQQPALDRVPICYIMMNVIDHLSVCFAGTLVRHEERKRC